MESVKPFNQEPRKRAKYTSGTELKPKEFVVYKCHKKDLLRLRGSGQKNERTGCGCLQVNFTAKHHGGLDSNIDWQAKCKCGKKTRLQAGNIDADRIFSTRKEATDYIARVTILAQKEAHIVAFAKASHQMKHRRLGILKQFCEQHGLEYNREVYLHE